MRCKEAARRTDCIGMNFARTHKGWGGIAGMLLLQALTQGALAATACTATSGPRMLPLVELFTSEGCDSCPPADRFLSATFPPGAAMPAASVLAFHVDYWDRLGWKDRFAAPAHTARQYAAMRTAGTTFVYTPQLLVQGRDSKPGRRDRVSADLAAAAAQPARATITLALTPTDAGATTLRATASVAPDARTTEPQLWLAYTESGLQSDVGAGENRGARLTHDHVVRSWRGPFAAGANGVATATVVVQPPAERGRAPAFVAVAIDASSGQILQTLTSPGCGGD
jgi:hypothetical protein